jgi:hypothetical protein
VPTPLPKKTWTITANNRITFVSLNDAVSKYLFGVKEFLKARGYTVRGSSNGTTSSPANTLVSDGVDRWVTAADVTTRGAASGNAQSWIVLRDAGGVDVLLAYQGATDDIARYSFSVGQLFTTQATGTFQPTATDEAVPQSGSTLINAAVTGDRVWFAWADSSNKYFRVAMARQGVFVGKLWGLERVFSIVNLSGLYGEVWAPAAWGFSVTPQNLISNGTSGGVARTVNASVAQTTLTIWGAEEFGENTTTFGSFKPELQGGFAFVLYPMSIGSSTVNARGKLGNLTDWWLGRTSGAVDGDMYNDKRLITVGGTGAVVWPWDNTTAPVVT